MKKDLTELVFILDMSGSMDHLTDDTIGGFNSVIREHNDKQGEVLVTTYLFNNDFKMIHDRLPIADVSPMTRKEYRAGGCTALLDTLGEAAAGLEQSGRTILDSQPGTPHYEEALAEIQSKTPVLMEDYKSLILALMGAL